MVRIQITSYIIIMMITLLKPGANLRRLAIPTMEHMEVMEQDFLGFAADPADLAGL
jgi:hypothetical protein